MDLYLIKSLAALALPPGINVLLILLGLVVWSRRPLIGLFLHVLGLGSLYAFSVAPVAENLARMLQADAAVEQSALDALAAEQAGAIVVLGGGRYDEAPEYGADTVSLASLRRVRYAAVLHRRTGLPLLVSGGSVYQEPLAEAELMARVLRDELDVPVRWVEKRSRNTAENALYSQAILAAHGVRRVLLVTDALHMPRALVSFERAGVDALAAPTGFVTGASRAPAAMHWLPRAGALQLSAEALHEALGRLWYGVRY